MSHYTTHSDPTRQVDTITGPGVHLRSVGYEGPACDEIERALNAAYEAGRREGSCVHACSDGSGNSGPDDDWTYYRKHRKWRGRKRPMRCANCPDAIRTLLSARPCTVLQKHRTYNFWRYGRNAGAIAISPCRVRCHSA